MRDIINRHLNLKIRASALCTGAFLCVVFAAPCAASSQKQLDGVKQEISRQKNQLDSKQQNYAVLQKQLKQHELDIAQTANKIHQTNDLLAQITQSITKLEQQQQHLQQQQQQQLGVLKTLINAQYRQGNNSDIANLLSGENSAKLDRMTTYAEYVSKARATAIDALDATQTELQLKIHTLAEQKNEHQQVLAELNQQKQQLDGQQQSRQLTLNKIKSQIHTSTEALADLRSDEQDMLAAIAKAKAQAIARAKAQAEAEARAKAEAQARIVAAKEAKAKAIAEAQAKQLNARYAKMQVPMDGLSSHKGKLVWPLRGPILHNYGAPLQRELHWKGMVISQAIGSQVKAIYSGKVVFADWLRGYGLMIAIDHGKGDMSFYGYNQTLLKKIGDTVQAGEPIALVGDSGGQEQPGLYFQIRRKGTPVDPRPWLTR
ncbi:peptidase M23 [Photobacterium phosphoreum]|uniref:murein hydrolase activator EnvC n=1 Tax=Photobacterium phosphoreum TaxID=659 RepID=UPI000D1619CC|nr:murein hydrolase activator EnvC [Photobacterium phosphoreum]PSU70216.1 peptidase M23 [Photobacterium phosphoreum]PSU83017.1 peptidase M23 [Photobacterium phosphoreum]PSW33006.1 peptidase M23 [Photobacterium phosphoreum]PTB33218.1 peptidase M23 [Photobacterium phosphoreum]